MKLTKFIVQEIERRKNVGNSYSFGDWEMKHPKKHIDYIYHIKDDKGNMYYLHSSNRPIRITKGQTIRCFVNGRLDNDNDNEFDIKYHVSYKKYLLTDYMFQKAKEDYIKRNKDNIKYYNDEIERLKNL